MVGNVARRRSADRNARKTKGELTRAAIVASAAEVFNVNGYAGTSIADVLAKTGLEKGGLYNHFASKDELALAAFDHAAALLEAQYRRAQDRAPTAPAKLLAFIDVFAATEMRSPMRGGCPLLNTAVGSTNVHPQLRERARAAFARALERIADIVSDGIECGTIRASADAQAVASQFLAALEGAVMLSRLYADFTHMRHAAGLLRAEVARLSLDRKPRPSAPSARRTL